MKANTMPSIRDIKIKGGMKAGVTESQNNGSLSETSILHLYTYTHVIFINLVPTSLITYKMYRPDII